MTREELLGLLMPLVCVAAICIAGRFLAPTRWRKPIAPAVGALAVGIALAAGYVGGFELPGFPPHARWQWLFWLAIGAGVLGGLGLMWSSQPRWSVPLASAVWACALAAVLRFDWVGPAVVTAIAVGVWTGMVQSLLTLPKPMRASAMPLAMLAICAAAAAPVLFMSGQARFAQLAASLMVTVAAIAVGALLWRNDDRANEQLRAAAAWCGTALLFAIAYVGWAYSEDGTAGHAEYVLLGIAPLTAWIGHVPWLVRRPAWQRWAVTLLVISALLAVAVWLAWSSYAPPAESRYDGMY